MRYRLFSILIAFILTISCVSGFQLSHAEEADTADQIKTAEQQPEKSSETKKRTDEILKASLKDVSIRADVTGAFKEDVTLKVKAVQPDANAKKAFKKQNIDEDNVKGYDISFMNKEGKELEPDQKVNISMTFKKNDDQISNKIIHVNDEGKSNIIKANVSNHEVSFKSDAFSEFYLLQNNDNAQTLWDKLKDPDNNYTVKLNTNLTISDSTWHTLEHSCTLDLNGHTLTIDGSQACFVVNDGITFTLKDSTGNGDSTGRGQITGSRPDQILEVHSNGHAKVEGVHINGIKKFIQADGATVEIDHSQFTNCGDADNTAISSNGTLHVSDSTFTGNKGTNGGVIYANGGNATFTGNTFENNTGTNGGAVNVIGGAPTFTDNIFRNNTVTDEGGAVKVENVTATFRNNQFTGNKGDKGGAIFIWNATVTIPSGSFNSNEATNTDWIEGGGAIYVGNNGSNLTLDDNNNSVTFDQNFAAGSGGAIMAHEINLLTINGGNFTNNISQHHEGGAISLGYGKATITKGIFSGNKTGYTKDEQAYSGYGDWGGGAIFCSDKGTMNFPTSVVDTDNTAHGFGGGLAGCSTARLYTFGTTKNGIAVYGNHAQQQNASGSNSAKSDDHTYGMDNEDFKTGGSNDIACFLSGQISNTMFGGAQANYKGTVDGKAFEATNDTNYITCSSVLGLNAQNNGPKNGDVKITGNESYTHGGGILNNGIMMFGTSTTIKQGTSVALTADKTLIDQDTNKKIAIPSNNNFSFSVHKDSEDGEVVSTGKVAEPEEGKPNNYEIKFNNKLIFNPDDIEKVTPKNKVYNFTYYLTENKVKTGFEKDNAVYEIQVHLVEVTTKDQVGNQSVTRVNYYVDKDNAFTVYKKDSNKKFVDITSQTSWGYNNGTSHDNDDKHSPYLKLESDAGTFRNTELHHPNLTVQKKVEGEAGDKTKKFNFKITLKDAEDHPIHEKIDDVDFDENGEAEISLSDNQKKEFHSLPYGTKYTIEETDGQGYEVTYSDGSGTGTLTEDKAVTVTNTKNFNPDTGYHKQNNGLYGIAIIGVMMAVAAVVMKVMKGKHE